MCHNATEVEGREDLKAVNMSKTSSKIIFDKSFDNFYTIKYN